MDQNILLVQVYDDPLNPSQWVQNKKIKKIMKN